MGMESAVRSIGVSLKRSPVEISAVIEKLKRHWVNSLSDWRTLSIEKRKLVGLPLLLQHKIDELALNTPTIEGEPCILNRLGTIGTISLNGELYELLLEDNSLLTSFLEKLGSDGVCALYTNDNKKVDPQTSLAMALIPGRKLVIGDSIHPLRAAFEPSAIDRWLLKFGMEKYTNLFFLQNIDDYFTIPFLRADILELMGIASADDRKKIMDSVRDIRNSTPSRFVSQWISLLGFENAATVFQQEEIDLHCLLLLKEADLVQLLNGDATSAATLFEKIDLYARFSSVEETFRWLQVNGFEKYSFHFARYNIPFYALPFVNFFVINEIGVTSEDQKLLNALQLLKDSPAYNVKGVAYWLRDLEMENYNLVFSNNLLFNLETLTILNDTDIDRLVLQPSDREKMRMGIQEMKEFQFYYSATASLLQELGMERYSDLFAHHGISIDVLPLLSEAQLKEMGVTDPQDRERIMNVVRKLQGCLPDDDSWPYSIQMKKKGPSVNPRRGSMSCSSKRLKAVKDTPRSREISLLSSDIRSVEEWLAFINDDSRPVVLKESPIILQPISSSKSPSRKSNKKKRRRTRGTTNTNTPPELPTLAPPTQPQEQPQAATAPLTTLLEDKCPSIVLEDPSTLTKPPHQGTQEFELVPSMMTMKTVGKSSFLSMQPDFEEGDSEFDDLDDMDPELKAKLDKEVEEFRLRLESVSSNSKSKLTPLFYLPD